MICHPHGCKQTTPLPLPMVGVRVPCTGVDWVAVKELKLSYHNGYIYIVNNRVSPI